MSKSENIKNLIQLVKENPELPIVPMVDGEIPGDDCGRWMGAFGCAYVDEYLLIYNKERVAFKSDDDIFEVLECCLTDEEFEALPKTEAERRSCYDALPWIKAIIVNIDLPDNIS